MTAPSVLDPCMREGGEAIPFAGGLVVVERGGARLRLLNAGAAAIWTLLDGGFTHAQAAALLADHGGGPVAQASADIAAFEAGWSGADVAGDELGSRPRVRIAPAPPRLYRVAGVTFRLGGDDQEVLDRVEAALADRAVRTGDAAVDLHVRVDEGSLELLVDGEPWLRGAVGRGQDHACRLSVAAGLGP